MKRTAWQVLGLLKMFQMELSCPILLGLVGRYLYEGSFCACLCSQISKEINELLAYWDQSKLHVVDCLS